MSRLLVVDNLRIASPCDAAWQDMAGDERRRFCGQCDKHVYDLTTMEPDEVVSLIEETEGKFCGRMYQRSDGTVLTDDCPVGLARVLRRARRRTYQAAAFALTLAASAASFVLYGTTRCDAFFGSDAPVTRCLETIEAKTPPEPTPRHVAGQIAVPVPAPEPEPEMMMGDIAFEPDEAAQSVRR